MGEPFIGEIRLLPYNFVPLDYVACDGSLLSISENDALFALIGMTYGGDGVTNFAVPDLRGRVPIHQGQGAGLSFYSLGQAGGVEAVTLVAAQMGAHSHAVQASTATAASASPVNAVFAAVPSAQGADTFYANPTNAIVTDFNATAVQQAGGAQPHDNTAPTIVLQYCIATNGIFPSQP